MTVIVSGFPGIGKTHCYDNDSTAFLDSDSSRFSWLEPGIRRSPDFPQNYIEHIKEYLGMVDFIFVSSHKEVRDALVAEGLAFVLVYPEAKLKEEYLQRFRDRGSPEAFISMINSGWVSFMVGMDEQVGCRLVRLKAGEFLSDALTRGDLS